MDSASAGENSGEAVTVAVTQMPSSMKKTTEPLRKHNRRHATDKYWSGLFIVILIIWIVSWQYVIHHQLDFNVVTENITVTNKIPEFAFQQTDYYIPQNGSAVKNIYEVSYQESNNEIKHINNIDMLHFLLDTLTCNLSHMGARSKKLSNSPYADAVGSVYCFIGSLFLLRFNKILRRHPSFLGVIFVYVSLLEHLSITFHSNDSVVNLSLPSHEKLARWVMPEAMFLMIWLSKMFSEVHHKNSKNLCVKRVSRNVNSCSDENSADDETKDDFDFKKFRFYHCVHAIVISFPFIITLKLLMNSAISVAYNMGWHSAHSYIIAGGSYYLGLTVYYFGLMVTSCTFSIASRARSQSIYKSYLRALFTVARYHSGTACYQATPMIPGLHAISVMKEPRLNQLVRHKCLIERFFITHGKIYKLTTTLTSVDGTNHSETIRNLLCLYYGKLLTKKSLQDFGSVSKSLFFFLLSTNSLAIVSLAAVGTLDDSLSLATWVMYLKIVFIFNAVMGFITSISDTFEISKMQSKLGDFSGEDLREGVFSHYFLKDQQSDDAENV